MIEKKGDFNFTGTLKNYNRFKRFMPKIVGNMAKNHFLEGFRKGGGQTDKSRSGWKPRKPARSARQKGKDSGRALLVLTGNMRGGISMRSSSFRRTVVNVINIPYAIYHNRGQGKIPQREFIGLSADLNKRTIFVIRLELKRLEKK
jgi:phage gpG-like protein